MTGTQTLDLSGDVPAARPLVETAARPAEARMLPPSTRRPSPWPARLMWLLVAGIGMVIALALLANLFVGATPLPMSIHIDGDPGFGTWGWDLGAEVSQMPPAHKVMLAVVAMMALLAALVIVPLVVAFIVGAVALALLVGIGIPLLVVLLIGAIVLSPLWLLGWLVWKLVAG